MKKLMWILVLCGILATFACKKDDPDDPASAGNSEYLQLKPGNYWVFDVYKIDSLGIATLTNLPDSVTVARDTLINNTVYYVLEGRTGPTGYDWKILGCYRDSSKCLVNERGEVLFSETNFSDTINTWMDYWIAYPDTLFFGFTKMKDPGQLVTVPAGTFKALNAKSLLTMYYPYNPPGNETRHITLNRFFGLGVGEILSSYAFANEYYQTGSWYERRLVRYYVTP